MPANPLRTIADALVAALAANGFAEAARRPLPFTEREQCATRQTTVIVRSGQYPDGSRSGFDRVSELAIVIQQGIDRINNNTAVDELVDDVGALIALWDDGGPLRHVELAGATHLEGPEHPTGMLYEPALLNESKLFTSITVVRYGLLA